MHSILKTAAIAAVLALSSTAADAALFKFSYQFDGGRSLSGVMDGTLQSDGNTILLSSIPSWNLGGIAGPALGFMTNYDEDSTAFRRAKGWASLDGSVLDFLACSSSRCLIGIGADSDGSALSSPYLGAGFYSRLVADSSYSAADFKVSAIPLPATLLLLAAAAGLLGVAARRPVTV